MKNDAFENLHAMVIDDIPSMRELLAQLLMEMGFADVVTSEDGADALSKIESAPIPISVVICDLEMPLIGGIEFIQMLRGHRRADIKDTPIVVVTGHSEKSNLHQAVQAGVHGFLVKPVSRKALEAATHHALTGNTIDPAVFAKKPAHLPGEVRIIEG